MTDKPMKNVPASVRQRLLNKAKQDRRPFNELFQYYGMDRFLYRLSKSPYARQFVLKLGALNSRMKDFYDIWVLSVGGAYRR